jgi:hypothetical protein
MGRAPCCDRTKGLKKGPWTPEEDKLLVDYIQANGHGSWRLLPKLAGQDSRSIYPTSLAPVLRSSPRLPPSSAARPSSSPSCWPVPLSLCVLGKMFGLSVKFLNHDTYSGMESYWSIRALRSCHWQATHGCVLRSHGLRQLTARVCTHAGLNRCGKSCRLRWTNYLRPDIKRGPFSPEEQKSIVQLHAIVGNK